MKKELLKKELEVLEHSCDMNAVIGNFPVKSSKIIGDKKLKSPELKKIVHCFQSNLPATHLIN